MGAIKRYKYNYRLLYRPLLLICCLVVLASLIGAQALAALENTGVTLTGHIYGTGNNSADNSTNILIIGNNARKAGNPLSLGTAGGQADILILVHIDPGTKTITLISIPRDTLVALPGWNIGIPKIKSVFTLGLEQSPAQGPQMIMRYVGDLTGLPVTNYVAVDFKGFIDIINAVGGVYLDVPDRLYDPLHSHADLYPGWQTLDGDQALAYVRIRQNEAGNGYRITDYQRQQAELQVLDILRQKILDSYKNPAQLAALVSLLHKDVATNLSAEQIIGLAKDSLSAKISHLYLGSDKDSMDILSAPATGLNDQNFLTGAYYDVLDPQRVYSLLRPLGSTGPGSSLPSLPPAGEIPLEVYGPPGLVQQLRAAGFTSVTYRGPATQGSQVTITYPPGKLSWAWVVGRFSGNGNETLNQGPAGLTSVIYQVP